MKRINAVNILGVSPTKLAGLVLAFLLPMLHAETCTTQSALPQPERDAIATAARTLAAKIQEK